MKPNIKVTAQLAKVPRSDPNTKIVVNGIDFTHAATWVNIESNENDLTRVTLEFYADIVPLEENLPTPESDLHALLAEVAEKRTELSDKWNSVPFYYIHKMLDYALSLRRGANSNYYNSVERVQNWMNEYYDTEKSVRR